MLALGLAAVGIALEIDLLVLERAPQPLDEHVVHPAPATIHRDAHAGSRQRAGEGSGSERAALVCVEDAPAPPPAPTRRTSHPWCWTATRRAPLGSPNP